MDGANQLTHSFCEIDDFCKEFDKNIQHKLLFSSDKKTAGPAPSLTTSEIMTILVMFHH